MSRSSDNRWKYGTRCIVAGESCLTHARSIVDNNCCDIFVTHSWYVYTTTIVLSNHLRLPMITQIMNNWQRPDRFICLLMVRLFLESIMLINNHGASIYGNLIDDWSKWWWSRDRFVAMMCWRYHKTRRRPEEWYQLSVDDNNWCTNVIITILVGK